MFLLKRKRNSPKGNICQNKLSEIFYIKKIIYGGFINIQERRTIMKEQRGTDRSNKLSWKV